MVTYPDGSTDTLQVPVNPAIATVLARYPYRTIQPARMVPNLCCAFKREHGYGSVFHPHRSESWPKRTTVWSIQLRQSDGTDNKSRFRRCSIRALACSTWIGSGAGSITYTRTVSPHLSLVDVGEFHANDAFVL